MSKLTDTKKLNTNNVFMLFLNNGHHTLLIAKCSEVDAEKMLVVDPYYVMIVVDDQGHKSTMLLPFAHDTLMETSSSFFDYKDILTIYEPKDDFLNYYLSNLAKLEYEKFFGDKQEDNVVTKTTIPTANNEEKVIHVDFKTKKRKPNANVATVIVATEPEPEGAA